MAGLTGRNNGQSVRNITKYLGFSNKNKKKNRKSDTLYSGFGGLSSTVISGFGNQSNKNLRKKPKNSEYKFKMRKRPKKSQYENKVLGYIHQELKKIPEVKYVIGDWIVSLETRFKKVFYERDILKCVNCKPPHYLQPSNFFRHWTSTLPRRGTQQFQNGLQLHDVHWKRC